MSDEFYPGGPPASVGQRRAQAINERWDAIARAMRPRPVNDFGGTFDVYVPEFGTCELNPIPLGNCPICWPRPSMATLDPETGCACGCQRGCEPDHIDLALQAIDEPTRARIASMSQRVAS